MYAYARRSSRPTVRAKLKDERDGDRFEHEADRAAERAVSAPAPTGKDAPCACGGTCERCSGEKGGQDHAEAGPHPEGGIPVSGLAADVLRSAGQPLSLGSRAFFEPRLGHDFRNVRVHTDERAAAAAHSIGARAFTAGSEVVFGRGEYAPDTHGGRRLLAHELTHVKQQAGALPAQLGAAPSVQRAPARPARKTIWVNVGFDSSAQANETTMKKLRASIASEKAALASCCSAHSLACNIVLKTHYDWVRYDKPAPKDGDYDSDVAADRALRDKNFDHIKGPAGGLKVLVTESTLSQTWQGARIFPRANTGAKGVLWNRALAADDTIAHEAGHAAGYVGDDEGGSHSSDPANLMSPGSIRQADATPDTNWCTQIAATAH